MLKVILIIIVIKNLLWTNYSFLIIKKNNEICIVKVNLIILICIVKVNLIILIKNLLWTNHSLFNNKKKKNETCITKVILIIVPKCLDH